MSCTPFAYNPGAPLPNTTQYCTLAVGNENVSCGSNYGGLQWWAGPDDTLGYVIANVRLGGQPPAACVTGGPPAYVGFWRSKLLTEQSFLDLANYIAMKNNQPPFTNSNDAVTWLNNNCYYTSFVPTTPTPTQTVTNTSTPTTTQTPTNTPTQTVTPSGLGGFFFTTKYTIETSVPNNNITLPSSLQNCDFGQTYSFGFMSVAATSSKYLPSSTVTNNGVTNTVTNNFVSGSSPYNFSSYQLGFFEGSGTTTRIQYVVKKNGVQVDSGNFLNGGRPANQGCNAVTGLVGITSLAANDVIEIIWSLYVAPTPTQTRTQTPTLTQTQTQTQTPSLTQTQTQTQTPTNTITQTPTNTITQTITNTPSLTPSNTQTSTPTATLGLTPTATSSETPTLTMTPTYTPTLTMTPTVTPTPTCVYYLSLSAQYNNVYEMQIVLDLVGGTPAYNFDLTFDWCTDSGAKGTSTMYVNGGYTGTFVGNNLNLSSTGIQNGNLSQGGTMDNNITTPSNTTVTAFYVVGASIVFNTTDPSCNYLLTYENVDNACTPTGTVNDECIHGSCK